MTRRSRAVSGAGNFWPGYVDAMSNVVMNLLFLVAMFAISAGILGATKGGTITLNLPDLLPAVQTQNRESAKESKKTSPGGETVAATSNQETTASVAPVKPGVERSLSGGKEPTQPEMPSLLSRPMSVAIASPLPPVFLQVTDAKRALGGPVAKVVRRNAGQGGLLLQVDLPSGGDPILELQREGVRHLLRSALTATPAQRLRIWSNVGTPDASARRHAFAALAALRNALVDTGWKPQQIETRLIDGANEDEQGGQRLYILMLPIDETPAPASAQLG